MILHDQPKTISVNEYVKKIAFEMRLNPEQFFIARLIRTHRTQKFILVLISCLKSFNQSEIEKHLDEKIIKTRHLSSESVFMSICGHSLSGVMPNIEVLFDSDFLKFENLCFFSDINRNIFEIRTRDLLNRTNGKNFCSHKHI